MKNFELPGYFDTLLFRIFSAVFGRKIQRFFVFVCENAAESIHDRDELIKVLNNNNSKLFDCIETQEKLITLNEKSMVSQENITAIHEDYIGFLEDAILVNKQMISSYMYSSNPQTLFKLSEMNEQVISEFDSHDENNEQA
jgi:hypothetical protein